jgi:hypothetical protein
MSVPKSLKLATVLILELTTLANAPSHPRLSKRCARLTPFYYVAIG